MIQNITEPQARQYLAALFYRLGFNDNETDRVLSKLPGTLASYVKALDSEARKYHGQKYQTIH